MLDLVAVSRLFLEELTQDGIMTRYCFDDFRFHSQVKHT